MDTEPVVLEPAVSWMNFERSGELHALLVSLDKLPNWQYMNFTSDTCIVEYQQSSKSIYLEFEGGRVAGCIVYWQQDGAVEFDEFVRELIKGFDFVVS